MILKENIIDVGIARNIRRWKYNLKENEYWPSKPIPQIKVWDKSTTAVVNGINKLGNSMGQI